MKYQPPKPIYPHIVLQDRRQLYEMVGYDFYLPKLEQIKRLKEGDLVRVVGYHMSSVFEKGRSGDIWLRVEMASPKYELYIGRVISLLVIDVVLKSKMQYLPFYPDNVAEIFQPDEDPLMTFRLEKLLDEEYVEQE